MDLTKNDIVEYLKKIYAIKPFPKSIYASSKNKLEKFLTDFIKKDFLKILKNNEEAYRLYYRLVWDDAVLNFKDFFDEKSYKSTKWWDQYQLNKEYCFITRQYEKGYTSYDIIYIRPEIRRILQEIFEKPKFYYLIDKNVEGKYRYKNEFVLDNFNEIKHMKNNGLFKDIDKISKKEIKLINASEFYPNDRKYQYLAREFIAKCANILLYHEKVNKISETVLKEHILGIFKNRYYRSVNSLLISHLKYIRDLPDLEHTFCFVMFILIHELKDEFISIENIISFLKYRNALFFRIPTEVALKSNDKITAAKYPNEIVIFPAIKGFLFYLAALGVVEIIYDDIKNPYSYIDTDVISPFDGLKGVKLTEFGKFITGKIKNYNFPKSQKEKETITFDEFKPIVKLQNPSAVTVSQLENFAKKLDENTYSLDFKIFLSGCENIEDVEYKIKEFNKFFKKAPIPFKNFINEIKNNLNSFSREDFIILKITNDDIIKHIKDKKISDLILKAEGKRILIKKKELRKFINAMKEKGIFVNVC